MYLRKLELQDAPLMLDWMHDQAIVENLYSNFAEKTIADVEQFIEKSWIKSENIHLAIVSDSNEYMGTVSLKHIVNGSAEFAIIVRSEAMGRGYAWFGMQSIIEKAFNELGLESVYWCVSLKNKRAVRFYDKHNFHETLDIPLEILKRYEGLQELKWYSVLKGDELNSRDFVVGCKIIHIKTIPTVNSGELSFFEGNRDISFDIKRIYYISKVPEGIRRGFHAHKKLKQLLFCPFGKIRLILENDKGREEIVLSDPSIGVLIDRPTWREMQWLQSDSVLCVAANEFYQKEDYIRDYEEFKKYINSEDCV